MWNTKAVLGGTSIAVLTYIGFDGISTLSEEAENPKRNILLATMASETGLGEDSLLRWDPVADVVREKIDIPDRVEPELAAERLQRGCVVELVEGSAA